MELIPESLIGGSKSRENNAGANGKSQSSSLVAVPARLPNSNTKVDSANKSLL